MNEKTPARNAVPGSGRGAGEGRGASLSRTNDTTGGLSVVPLDIAQPNDQDTTPRPLAFSLGGRTATALTVKDYTFEAFAKLLSTPKVGQKDGSYYLRGGELKALQRADENLVSAWLIIIDGDAGFDPETGELTGAPPLKDVHAALTAMNVTHHIHATHSARPAQGIHKYRAVVPVERLASPDELNACVEYLFDQLHAKGVTLVNANENKRWAQLWYLARVPTADDLPAFECATHFGDWLDVPACVRWLEKRAELRRKEETLPSAPPVSRALQGHDSPIAQFNDAHGAEWVRRELEARGYRHAYYDQRAMGGQGGHRYIRPGSSTGQPGVVVFTGARGHACVFSHHGNEDPLSGKTHDPFALFAAFHHHGDLRAAARAILPPEQSIAERIRERDQGAAEAPVNELRRDQKLVFDASYPQEIASGAKKDDPFVLEHWAALEDKPVRWLVKGVIPAGGFIALFGKPGTFKSFGALYIGSMVASGQPCFGQETEQTAVVYIAGEGGGGMRNRMRAIRSAHNLPKDAPIFFLRRQIDLRSTLEDADKLIRAIEALGVKVGLLIIDTLARAFAGGNENASEDMGAFMAICAMIQRRLDCAVLIVHHSGKDEARGMRGHSSLFGAIDAELEVTRQPTLKDEQRYGQLRTTKQKDGEDGLTFPYRLDVIHVSKIDPEATSLVVVPVGVDEAEGMQAAAGRRRRNLTTIQQNVLKALRDAINSGGRTMPHDRAPSHVRGVSETLWRETYYGSTTGKQDTKLKQFDRASAVLLSANVSGKCGDWCWISDSYE